MARLLPCFRIDEQKAKMTSAMGSFENEVSNPLAEKESAAAFESEDGAISPRTTAFESEDGAGSPRKSTKRGKK
eukprot:COSAG02_NODE_2658_length_8313_cov_3.830411_6_plen_74_part_00